MAINAVQVPNAPTPIRPEKEESWLDVLLKGLQVANAGAGIYEKVQEIGQKSLQGDIAQRQAGMLPGDSGGKPTGTPTYTQQEANNAKFVTLPAEREFAPGEQGPLLPDQTYQNAHDLLPAPGGINAFKANLLPGNGAPPKSVYLAPEDAVASQRKDIDQQRTAIGKENEALKQAELNWDNLKTAAQEAATKSGGPANMAAQQAILNAAKLSNPNVARSANNQEVIDSLSGDLQKMWAKVSGNGSAVLDRNEIDTLLKLGHGEITGYAARAQGNLEGIKESVQGRQLPELGKDLAPRTYEMPKTYGGSAKSSEPAKAPMVIQNGHVYHLNKSTGKYTP